MRWGLCESEINLLYQGNIVQLKPMTALLSRTRLWLQREWAIILLILITIPTFLPLLRPGYFWMQDDMQAFRTLQLDRCVKDLQIPCRWVPDAGYSYGYPLFNYYPPFSYVVMEGYHLLGLEFVDSVKAAFATGFILSAVFMYIFMRRIFGNVPAFAAAVFYTYAPFKAIEVYVRGASAEFWALVFYPLVYLFIYDVVKKGRFYSVALLSIAIGLLMQTHLLMSVIFMGTALAWAMYLLCIDKAKHRIAPILLGFVWGVANGAYFILPAIFEKQLAHTESLVGGYFGFLQHFVDIKQLFVSRFWGYGDSVLGTGDGVSFSVGHAHWILAVAALFVSLYFFLKKDTNKKIPLIIWFFGAVSIGALVMMHSRSTPIWLLFKPLEYLQFPWRFLSITLFTLSVLSGALFYFIKAQRLRLVAVITACLAVIVLNSTYYQPRTWYPEITDKEKFSGLLWQKQLTISIFDYLPIYATLPPTSEAPRLPEVLSGEITFHTYDKRTDTQKLTVTATTPSEIRLPTYYFPEWQVMIDNQKVPIRYDNYLGLITFTVPQGDHTITAKLYNTPIRIIGNTLTLVGILGLLGTAFYYVKNWKLKRNVDAVSK